MWNNRGNWPKSIPFAWTSWWVSNQKWRKIYNLKFHDEIQFCFPFRRFQRTISLHRWLAWRLRTVRLRSFGLERSWSKFKILWNFWLTLEKSLEILNFVQLSFLTMKDKLVVYFIRWISCGWKQNYIIQKYRQRKLLHEYMRGWKFLLFYDYFVFRW